MMNVILRKIKNYNETEGPFLLDSIGQIDLCISGALDGEINGIYIPRPFGRFGNNLYQCLNALTILHYINQKSLVLQGFNGPSCEKWNKDRFYIESNLEKPNLINESWLCGSFYAPFGLEAAFEEFSVALLNRNIKLLSDTMYKSLTEEADLSQESALALHFRGGDVFDRAKSIHSWYVQPPVSYYILAINHAISKTKYDKIKLIFEDLSNPAVAQVSSYLESINIPHIFIKQDFRSDVVDLISAETIVSSPSTLSEVCMFLSNKTRSYYSFRGHSSQIDFGPFCQEKVWDILKFRNISGIIINDATMTYIPQKQWDASDNQLRLLCTFPLENLRLYQTTV